MGFQASFKALLLSASLVLAHPGHEKVYQHNARELEARSLDHCDKAFSHPEFVKRTVEIHGEEYGRLRRALGLESQDL